MPLPAKTWATISNKPFYPKNDVTYDIDPAQVPIADPDRDGRHIVESKQGRIWLWNPTLIELAQLVKLNEYKAIQVVFYREENRTHVRQVSERLE